MSRSGGEPGGGNLRRELTNLPNVVTISRVLLVPFVLLLIDNYNPLRTFLASMLYVGAAAGDALDGYLARKRNQVSVLGKFLDPLADKVLLYVDDPVDAFFLEIQGSGRVQLPDGHVLRVGYADQNGQPFRSIARVLIDRGELSADRASMQSIRTWGREHAQDLPQLLEENPSYVFFREVPPPTAGSLEAAIDGPIGTLGVPLARERTIAVDAHQLPLGAPMFLDTTRPLSALPLQRLVLAQDTGGAIRGAVRADFFWGFGADAARDAGRMKQEGRLWVLWPKDAGTPQPWFASQGP